MKDQIRQAEWNGADSVSYSLKIRNEKSADLRRITADNSEHLPLIDMSLSQTLDALGRLAAEHPDAQPAPPPLRSEIMLENGTVIVLPHSQMQTILEDAWFDARKDFVNLQNTQMMGAVTCTTFKPDTVSGPVNGFMGLGMMMQQMQQKQAVRIDRETWNCACGQEGLHAKFCPECGMAAPPFFPEQWDCPNCGTKSLTGKFCPECGSPVPALQ